MTDRALPFILEASLSVDARMLIFAENTLQAAELLEAKMPELQKFLEAELQQLALNAMLKPDDSSEKLLAYFDVRPAEGREVIGSEALKPDEITLDTCNHEDHEHEHGED